MGTRGPYAKGVAKRDEILTVALDLIARVGYSNTTVKQLADAVGSTPTRVIYYFGSKEALFEEVLRRRDRVETDAQRALGDIQRLDDLLEAFIELLRHSVGVPGLVQLDTRLKTEASEPTHPSHGLFEARYQGARWAIDEVLQRIQSAGEIAEDADTAQLTRVLLATLDGLQAQWLYEPTLDMTEPLRTLFAVIRREPSSRTAATARRPVTAVAPARS